MIRRIVNDRLGFLGMRAVHRSYREEFHPAGIAAVSGDTEQPKQPSQPSLLHPVICDVLKLKVSAAGTIGMTHEFPSDSSRIKPPFALHASPWPESHYRGQSIDKPFSLGADAVVIATRGTNHRCLDPGLIFVCRINNRRGGFNRFLGEILRALYKTASHRWPSDFLFRQRPLSPL